MGALLNSGKQGRQVWENHPWVLQEGVAVLKAQGEAAELH